MAAALEAERQHVRQLEDDNTQLVHQLKEALKLVDLQQADLDRAHDEAASMRAQPAEHVPTAQLQLAFAEVLARIEEAPERAALEKALAEVESSRSTRARPQRKARPHGRRDLALENIPVEHVTADPDEALAKQRQGFVCIGEETSERIAYRPGGFIRLRIVRKKWKKIDARGRTFVTDPLPDSVWPHVMADPSAIAQVITAKYDDLLPVHRQQTISERHGFVVPKSTACGWLKEACAVLYRIPEAMWAEARRDAFCIHTDATSAPLYGEPSCERWHVFALIADQDHIVFRHAKEHTSEAIAGLLHGYRGYVQADAAKIHDVLFRDLGMTEVGCWFHQRRYFYRATQTDPMRATQAMAIIGKLFEVAKACADLPMPERTHVRAERARPILELFEGWIARNRAFADPKGPLDAAITYYLNQRDALWRFLEDGRLRLDNNVSEQALRHLVLGRHNWMYFRNETGLEWYTVFRSLIASARLWGLNPQRYLEQVLRLAPHWPTHRMLELAPKYWPKTLETLDARMREIIEPPWTKPTSSRAPPRAA